MSDLSEAQRGSETPKHQDAKTPSRTRIKICGLRDVATAQAAVHAGADFIGFVFVEQSPRYLGYEAARDIVRQLPESTTPVALVNHLTHRGQFFDLHTRSEIHLVQLHGKEVPGMAGTLPSETRLWRAWGAEMADDLELIEAWSMHQNLEAFLWDAPSSPDNPLGGGSGHTSDWLWLSKRLPKVRPSIVAGGLTPDNVGEAIRTVRPFAVDVSSGVESSRGVKDPGLIREFCAAVREADASLAMD